MACASLQTAWTWRPFWPSVERPCLSRSALLSHGTGDKRAVFKSRPRRRGYSSFRSRTRALGFHWFPPLPTPISVCGALASSLPFGVRLAIGTTLPRLGKAPSQARDSTIDRWNFSDTTNRAGEVRLPVTLPDSGNGLL